MKQSPKMLPLYSSVLLTVAAPTAIAQNTHVWQAPTQQGNQFTLGSNWSPSFDINQSYRDDFIINGTSNHSEYNGQKGARIDASVFLPEKDQIIRLNRIFLGESKATPGSLEITQGAHVTVGGVSIGKASPQPQAGATNGRGFSSLTLDQQAILEYIGQSYDGQTSYDFIVGDTGPAELIIRNGAQLIQAAPIDANQPSGWMHLGTQVSESGAGPSAPPSAANAKMILTGAGSLVDIQRLHLGEKGQGTIVIDAQAQMKVRDTLVIGSPNSSLYTFATLDVNRGDLVAGDVYLNMMNTNPTAARITAYSGGQNTVRINGALYMGVYPSMATNLYGKSNLYLYEDTFSYIHGEMYLGYSSSSNFKAHLETSGEFTFADTVYLGYKGYATWNYLNNQGTLDVPLYIGYAPNSNGTFYGFQSLSSPKSIRINGRNDVALVVGEEGVGNFRMTGFTLSSQNIVLGNQPTGNGYLALGETSHVLVDDDIIVGKKGVGTLIMGTDKIRSNTLDAESLRVATESASQGSVYLNTESSLRLRTGIEMGSAAASVATMWVGYTADAPIKSVGAGQLLTPKIDFLNQQAGLHLKYTDSTWQLNTQLLGNGYIVHDTLGKTIITGDSPLFHGKVEIQKGSVQIGGGALNGRFGSEGTSGQIYLNGSVGNIPHLIFDQTNALSVYHEIRGQGQIVKKNANHLTLTGETQYFQGDFLIDQGTVEIQQNFSQGSGQINYLVDTQGTLEISDVAEVYSVKNQGNLILSNADAQLTLLDHFEQTADGTLTLTVTNGSNSPSIQTHSAQLAGSLHIAGFASKAADPPVKASDLEGLGAILLQSDTPVTGGFAAADVQIVQPPQLVTQSYLINGGLAWSPDQKTLRLRDIQLAWTKGDATNATGVFDLLADTALDVDVNLADRTDLTSLQWDGKTLSKSGTGHLILSGQNTYTGDTLLQEGMLTIRTAASLGNSTALHIGSSQAGAHSATLHFGGATAAQRTLGLTQDLFLEGNAELAVQVDHQHQLAFTGSVQATSPFTKQGEGHLVLAPSVGNTVQIAERFTLANGDVTFRGQGDQLRLEGDMYLAGQSFFDITSGSTRLEGRLQGVDDDTESFTAYKQGSGALVLQQDATMDWHVEAGTLAVENANITGNMQIAPNAQWSFLQTGSVPVHTRYVGTVNGQNDSLLTIHRPQGSLLLQYADTSKLGDVHLQAGTLRLQGVWSSLHDPDAHRLVVQGDLQLDPDTHLQLAGSQSYLHVQGDTVLGDRTQLSVALDAQNPQTPDLLVQQLHLGDAVRLNFDGFALATPDVSARTPTPLRNIDGVMRASTLNDPLHPYAYFLLDAQDSITGDFALENAESFIHSPEYLLAGLRVQADSNGNAVNAARSEIWLTDFRLAWNEDSPSTQKFATGTFDLPAGTAFHVDVPLVDKTPNALKAWDGKSLLKKGDGTLILSSADNTYTGTTWIEAGTLILADTEVLRSSSQVTIAPNGVLDVYGTQQTLRQLNAEGTIQLGLDGQLHLAENAHHLLGTLSGGNGLHDQTSRSTLSLQGGRVQIGGTADLDHITIQGRAQLQLLSNSRIVADVQAQAGSQVSLEPKANWTLLHDSQFSDLTLAAEARIDFGLPTHSTNFGRTLRVGHWNGTETSELILYGAHDDSGTVLNDHVLISGTTQGRTKIQLEDPKGHVATALRLKDRITLVEPEGTGTIHASTFYGQFQAGTQEFPVRFDAQSGTVILAASDVRQHPDYTLLESALGERARGMNAHSVRSLGQLSRLSSTDCQATTFGTLYNQQGTLRHLASAGESDAKETGFLLGGDAYHSEIEAACSKLGWMASVRQTEHDYTVYGQQHGAHSMDSYGVGAYWYHADDSTAYWQASVMGFQDRLEISRPQRPMFEVRGTSWVGSLEYGRHYTWNTSYLQPSVQVLYQSGQSDHFAMDAYQTEVRTLGSWQVRLGNQWNLPIDEQTQMEVGTHVWFQSPLETEVLERTANSPPLMYRTSHQWSDVSVGVRHQAQQWEVSAGLNYQADWQQGGYSLGGQLGVRFHW